MGFIGRTVLTHALTINKCRCFAHDTCFKFIRNSLEKHGIEWEEELLESRDKGRRFEFETLTKMDRAFFHADRFEILIDARGFRPEEIKCAMTGRSVEVNAQKEDQTENAQKRMSLIRQYLLPQNAIPENGQCCLSSDGMLLITAPWLK